MLPLVKDNAVDLKVVNLDLLVEQLTSLHLAVAVELLTTTNQTNLLVEQT